MFKLWLSADTFYQHTLAELLNQPFTPDNRTGIKAKTSFGLAASFPMESGIVLTSLKKVPYMSAFGEMWGFLRGVDNAEQMRELGSKVWDQNANANSTWLNNPARKGTDDLGRIYGQQWRFWRSVDGQGNITTVDQVKTVYDALKKGEDNRRLIITAWNPGELHLMALPPCHMFMEFGFSAPGVVDMHVHLRSNDVGLGMPFNLAQYSWLLVLMSLITGNKPGFLHYSVFNYHLYEDHILAAKKMLWRTCRPNPYVQLIPETYDLDFIDNSKLALKEWTFVCGYQPHPPIPMNMAV